MKRFVLYQIFVLVSLVGCGTIEGQRYLDDPVDFSLSGFFNGEVQAWGIVQGRNGNLLQRFEVEITGDLAGDELTLDERFTYSLGEGVANRVWKIDLGDGDFVGRAGDIAGQASGQDYGSAFFWAYEMDLPVGNREYRVNFEDWIWAFDEETIVNRSYIKKFGLVFAEVTIFMQKII